MRNLYETTIRTCEVPVTCKTCGWKGSIEKLEKVYHLNKQGFEMGFCPMCHERGETNLPLILVSMYGCSQGVRGSPSNKAKLMWRLGSGETRFHTNARMCMDCGWEIELCDGFAHAEDLFKALIGRCAWMDVRERCYRCVERSIGSFEETFFDLLLYSKHNPE